MTPLQMLFTILNEIFEKRFDHKIFIILNTEENRKNLIHLEGINDELGNHSLVQFVIIDSKDMIHAPRQFPVTAIPPTACLDLHVKL